MYPIIEVLKKHYAFLNDNDIPNLPSNTPYGNLILSWEEIQQRFDNVNDLIITLYEDFEIINNREDYDVNVAIKLTHKYYKQKFLTEQIIYWLRRTGDELISMLYILDYHKKNQTYPGRIKIESIGNFIKYEHFLPELRKRHFKLLNLLNEISNAYKHSFINSETHLHRGSEFPVVFALSLIYNNTKNEPKFYSVKLSDVLNEYTIFLEDVKKHLLV
ncbi:hypothetical protein RCC89_19270 [Cytophagaceae bacterium ABcell3]|nr:hypothetical protein RCC89_19270 [Cytophagaceae bacterium ABcell3]